MATIRGGERAGRYLAALVRTVGEPRTLRVGFLENATYPDGKSVAMIAAIQNFGAPGAGIPARPFFSNMIQQKSPEWGPAMANLLVANDMNVDRVLNLAGAAIQGQLKQSIIDTNDPPLAPSTIRRKGFAKPLIDTSNMINSVDYEVVNRRPR